MRNYCAQQGQEEPIHRATVWGGYENELRTVSVGVNFKELFEAANLVLR